MVAVMAIKITLRLKKPARRLASVRKFYDLYAPQALKCLQNKRINHLKWLVIVMCIILLYV